MATASLFSVTTTPTPINVAQTDGVDGENILLKVPLGGATVFVGGADLTAAQGYPVAAGESLALDLQAGPGDSSSATRRGELVYVMVAAGTQGVNRLLTGI